MWQMDLLRSSIQLHGTSFKVFPSILLMLEEFWWRKAIQTGPRCTWKLYRKNICTLQINCLWHTQWLNNQNSWWSLPPISASSHVGCRDAKRCAVCGSDSSNKHTAQIQVNTQQVYWLQAFLQHFRVYQFRSVSSWTLKMKNLSELLTLLTFLTLFRLWASGRCRRGRDADHGSKKPHGFRSINRMDLDISRPVVSLKGLDATSKVSW